jgi:hypothetical protein
VVADEVRAYQARQQEEALELIEYEPAGDDPAENVVSTLNALRLWQLIEPELQGEAERLLLYLTCIESMKPSEITARYGRIFPTVDDVYRIKRNALERLRRNQRLRQQVCR